MSQANRRYGVSSIELGKNKKCGASRTRDRQITLTHPTISSVPVKLNHNHLSSTYLR